LKVAVIGSGGREHTLVWKISQSKKVDTIYAMPGNGGISQLAECISIDVADISSVAGFCKDNEVDLVVIGPEVPLSKGLADTLRAANIAVVGPGSKGAMLESSKLWAKELMIKNSIPTAKHEQVSSRNDLMEAVERFGFPVVIKMDGLQAGKGVFICNNVDDIEQAADRIYKRTVSGETVVVEEFLNGNEASYMVITDGTNYIPLVTSRDHKKIYDGDKGPNTGGMGAVSPAPIAEGMESIIQREVIEPLLKGLRDEGIDYNGVIYAGLMILPNNEIRVLEFNARFGDPETQVILTRMESDIMDIFIPLGQKGKLPEKYSAKWTDGVSCCVVVAQYGYPAEYEKGDVISSLDNLKLSDGEFVFHAGTLKMDDGYHVNGGRVLGVTAVGDTLEQARNKAYKLTEKAAWNTSYYRKDIGVWE